MLSSSDHHISLFFILKFDKYASSMVLQSDETNIALIQAITFATWLLYEGYSRLVLGSECKLRRPSFEHVSAHAIMQRPSMCAYTSRAQHMRLDAMRCNAMQTS